MFLFIVFLTYSSFITLSYAGDTCIHDEQYENYSELGISYKFRNNALPWERARLFCLSENATLAIPKSKAEIDTLVKIFSNHPPNTITGSPYLATHVYLGFTDQFVENEWISVTGLSLSYFLIGFDGGEPNLGRAENCISMEKSGRYYDYPCARPAPFICQKDSTLYEDNLISQIKSYADPGYINDPSSGKSYKLHTDLQTWGTARSICYAEGGHLAVIRNKQEETFLISILNNPKNKVKYSQWKDYAYVSLHDMFTEGKFTTEKGEPIEQINYIRWANGQPNGGAGENCVAIYTTGELHDMPCNIPNLYFCEKGSD